MLENLLMFGTVMAGFVIAYALRNKLRGRLKLLLAFSGAFLLGILFLEIIPDLFAADYSARETGMTLLGGVFFQMFLEYFSRGAEHGHMHIHPNERPSIALIIALSIHAFLEGSVVHDGQQSVLLAILVHKLPIAIIVSSLLLRSTLKLGAVIAWTVFFALMSPLGYELTGYLSGAGMDLHTHFIMAAATGLMLHVGSTLILEASEDHKFTAAKVLVMIGALVLALLA